jgi:hypothetical protein
MIHHVETRHLFEYWNEPFARVALKTGKYQTASNSMPCFQGGQRSAIMLAPSS